jgi:hypothetical protein
MIPSRPNADWDDSRLSTYSTFGVDAALIRFPVNEAGEHRHSGPMPMDLRGVDNLCRHSPVFTQQAWRRVRIKDTTRGPMVWEVKAARVHLLDVVENAGAPGQPTDRQYWLIVARNPATEEIKYFVSNGAASLSIVSLLRVAFARWQVEKWFERAKQEAGFGSFEVRTYRSLIRHWLCSRLVMYFLADQTQRLRGEKSADHAGAGGRRRQHVGLEDLEPLVALVG